MKRILQAATAAFLLSVVGLMAGCASTGTTATSTAEKVQAAVAKACPVVQAGLVTVQALPSASDKVKADLAEIQPVVATICTQNATVDPSTVQALATTALPALIADVQASDMAPGTKQAIVDGLTAADVVLQLTLSQQ